MESDGEVKDDTVKAMARSWHPRSVRASTAVTRAGSHPHRDRTGRDRYNADTPAEGERLFDPEGIEPWVCSVLSAAVLGRWAGS